ncbi:hypothetical protein PAJL_1529 [Cutibacterium acnes HL042PA3]|nr:hypothetical protein HMPREF9578_02430 [Cutibacterium acnes HL110PA4]ESK58699.1 hypothetical protein PAJL_1529 [Cutibacterium acnes HL042PA3]MCW5114628.1 hypothetical protein [Cutibacterium acnes P05]
MADISDTPKRNTIEHRIVVIQFARYRIWCGEADYRTGHVGIP